MMMQSVKQAAVASLFAVFRLLQVGLPQLPAKALLRALNPELKQADECVRAIIVDSVHKNEGKNTGDALTKRMRMGHKSMPLGEGSIAD